MCEKCSLDQLHSTAPSRRSLVLFYQNIYLLVIQCTAGDLLAQLFADTVPHLGIFAGVGIVLRGLFLFWLFRAFERRHIYRDVARFDITEQRPHDVVG